jgi:hypothetical protein
MANRRLRLARPQVTFLGMISIVAAGAFALAWLVETRRIKAARLDLVKQSGRCARLERLERDKCASFVTSALFEKSTAEWAKRSLGGTAFWVVYSQSEPEKLRHLEMVRRQLRIFDLSVASERQFQAHARVARARADRFCTLKQVYSDAASRLWLPFTRDPLAESLPPIDENAGPSQSGAPAALSKEADGPTEIRDDTEKPRKLKTGKPPRGDTA